ncbi:MAG: hypothetical protein KIT72_06565 [Polyangiaceae bacterium]|nr:hypothetical protein [Polyangiaceae bacterium]MCW5790065.1 hypothetical protein [Polyangiaceae bacterium]
MAPLPLPRSLRDAAAGASWLALVAATSLGVSQVGRVRAQVSGEVLGDGAPRGGHQALGEGARTKSGRSTALKRAAKPHDSANYRLIVHTYKRAAGKARAYAGRPLASVQREVTLAELREGLSVDLVSLGGGSEDQVVVAWVEPGAATLELDGLTAVPPQGARVAAVRGQVATIAFG